MSEERARPHVDRLREDLAFAAPEMWPAHMARRIGEAMAEARDEAAAGAVVQAIAEGKGLRVHHGDPDARARAFNEGYDQGAAEAAADALTAEERLVVERYRAAQTPSSRVLYAFWAVSEEMLSGEGADAEALREAMERGGMDGLLDEIGRRTAAQSEDT